MSSDPICLNCKRPTHPSYAARYGGYCLDCSNAGVPELIEQRDLAIAAERASNEVWRRAVERVRDRYSAMQVPDAVGLTNDILAEVERTRLT